MRVTATDSEWPIFVGVGQAADVEVYLDGVAHDEIIAIIDGRIPEYRASTGGSDVAPPAARTFWAATATGPGTQEVNWRAVDGRWAVVVMNADGSTGVAATTSVGVRAGVPSGSRTAGPGS